MKSGKNGKNQLEVYNKKSILLFQVAGTTTYIELDKNQWKTSLENVLNHYVGEEDYDKCIEIRDLIKQI